MSVLRLSLTQFLSLCLCASLAASIHSAAQAQSASATPPVTTVVDTTAVADQTGYYEFQFNPTAFNSGSFTSSDLVTVYITNITYGPGGLTNDGGLTGANLNQVNSSGLIPLNGTYGNSFSFTTSFEDSGYLPIGDSDDLLLFLYDANGNYLTTTDPTGNDLAADITMTQNSPSPHGPLTVTPVAYSVTGSAPTAVPEPSSLAIFGLGLVGVSALAVAARRRR